MTTLASSDLAAGSYSPEQRFAGPTDVITKPGVIPSGSGELAAMTVLGFVAGEFVPFDSTGVDGSENAVAILAEAIDATSADVTAPVYVAGEFNVDELVFDAPTNTDALKLAVFPPDSPIVLKKLGYSG